MRSHSILTEKYILSYRILTRLCTSLSDSLGIINRINIAKTLLRSVFHSRSLLPCFDTLKYPCKSFCILGAFDVMISLDRKIWHPGDALGACLLNLSVNLVPTCTTVQLALHFLLLKTGPYSPPHEDLMASNILLLLEIGLEELLNYIILHVRALGLA